MKANRALLALAITAAVAGTATYAIGQSRGTDTASAKKETAKEFVARVNATIKELTPRASSASWLAARMTRLPRPTIPRDAGLALATLGLAYLALWWHTHASEMSPALEIASLVGGVALCAALGRFGALAAVAVLSAGGLGGRLPEASLSRRHLTPMIAGVAIAFGAAVAAAAVRGGHPPPPAVDFAVVPTGLVVRIVGVDGLDRRSADEMIARGEMPHLESLLAASAHGALRVEPEQVPAIVWTTIATGRGPSVHGIQSVGARRLPGMTTTVDRTPFTRAVGSATDFLRLTRTQPASSVLRGAKAFWNVASDKGLRVLVVNWWATWPADRVNGQIVTDRALLKLEKGGPPDRETHPDDLLERLRPLAAAAADAPSGRPRRIDGFAAAAARILHRSAPAADLEAVYLPGLDIVTMQQLGDASGDDVAGLSARMDAVRGHHRYVDEIIGALRADLPSNGVLVLVGDPGRRARQSGTAEGLIVIAGPMAAAGEMATGGERDIAPTALHLLGMPVSDELEGHVLEAALSPAFKAAHPVRRVSSYGARAQGPPRESAFDREMLEELRSLGYIQ